jgi:hypothetical protein
LSTPIVDTSRVTLGSDVGIQFVGAFQTTLVFQTLLTHCLFTILSLGVELCCLGRLPIGFGCTGVGFCLRHLCFRPLFLYFCLMGTDLVRAFSFLLAQVGCLLSLPFPLLRGGLSADSNDDSYDNQDDDDSDDDPDNG